MKSFILILAACLVSLTGFSQNWTWEIVGFGKKNKKKVEVIFDMIQDPSDPNSARNEGVRVWIPLEVIKERIYPNLPESGDKKPAKKKSLKGLEGLRFDKDPNTWNISMQIYPY